VPEPPVPPSAPISRKGDSSPPAPTAPLAMSFASGPWADTDASYRPCGKET
jgi:hypothetical protein